MMRQELLSLLRERSAEMAEQFNVASLAIFGSMSRDEATPESDVDILVQFRGPATFRGFFDLKFYLEALLGREVDLATEKMIRPNLRKAIEQDLIHVT
jgi:predicted nucleotidyltransferase